MQLIWLLATTLALITGCKSEPKPEPQTSTDPSKIIVACDRRAKEKMCADFFGAPGANAADHEAICRQNNGLTVPRCPRDGFIARCTRNDGQRVDAVMYQPITAEQAKAMCSDPGASFSDRYDP